MSLNQHDLALIIFAALLGALLILGLQTLRQWRLGGLSTAKTLGASKDPVFLFHDDVLVDATEGALALIAHAPPQRSEFAAMRHALARSFPDLGTALSSDEMGKNHLVCPNDPDLTLELDRKDHALRLSIHHRNAHAPLTLLAQDIQAETAERLHDVAQHSPQLIWQTDAEGQVIWTNRTFVGFCGEAPVTQDALQAMSDRLLPKNKRSDAQHRIAIQHAQSQQDQWMDVSTVSKPGSFLHFASDANAIMRADAARQDFVKTLGKTFAQLATGLAIFDKHRRLAMFNPALLDMTRLPVEFLSARPSVDTVLDRLREMRMMPEPRDYASWRDQFAAVEDAAKNGTYSASWSLPDGQTLRVIGKPHPDGAFAFLFEDITAEVSLTRRFRSDIETGQSVLDALPDGIAVFSQTGTLMLSNRAYARLWDTKPDLMLDSRDLRGELSIWQTRCVPTAMWESMTNLIQSLGPRQPWVDDVMLDDGRLLRCHANPIAAGMTMVRFAIAPPMRRQMQGVGLPDIPLQIGKR